MATTSTMESTSTPYSTMGGSTSTPYSTVGGSTSTPYSTVGGSTSTPYSTMGGSTSTPYSTMGSTSTPYSTMGGSTSTPYSTMGGSTSTPYSTMGGSTSTPYSTTPSTTLYNQSRISTTKYSTPTMFPNSKFDIGNNVDNLNDFMAKNTLIGSNLYISPMNSTGLDNINKQKNGKSKISSSFFPIVKLP